MIHLLGKMPFILFQIETARSWQCRGTCCSSSRGKLDTSTLRYGSRSIDDFASKTSISMMQRPGFDDSSSNATAHKNILIHGFCFTGRFSMLTMNCGVCGGCSDE